MSLEGIIVAFAMLAGTCDHPSIPSKYDQQIRSAVRTYWSTADQVYHCDYKAQLFEESALNPKAKSPVGAIGIAQVMPLTWEEIQPKAGLLDAHPTDAEASIRAGAYYMDWLGRRMTEPREGYCESKLKQAGYNTGLGNVWKSQKLARKEGYHALCFDEIRLFLPKVTGKHSKETCGYTDKIDRTTSLLRGKKSDINVRRGCVINTN